MSNKAFALFFQDLRDGRAHSEMSAALNELLNSVKETGKAGSLTLKIKVTPATKGGDVDKVTIADSVTLDLPKPERGQDFFWLDDDNGLTRNHPRQQTLELREAPAGSTSTLKEATQ